LTSAKAAVTAAEAAVTAATRQTCKLPILSFPLD